MTDEFFVEPQAAAILKHGILRRYLPVFTSMTGSRAGEVVYLDGYAGPGLYDDGSPGSPAFALQIAQMVANNRGRATLHGHLVEKNRRSVDQLRQLLDDHGAGWEVHHGSASEKIPPILASLETKTPLFAFIDPFGLPIPFDLMANILKRGGRLGRYGRRGGAATEVLMNFSVSGINRVGGQLTGQGSDKRYLKARDTMVVHMDEVLGGDWWQSIWRAGAPNRFELILEGYKARLGEVSPGLGVFDVPVADRWNGPACYHLLLLTQHDEGVWQFNEAVSNATEEFRDYCHKDEGQLELETAKDRDARWSQQIERNIRRILAEGAAFKPVDRIVDVFGDTFGAAREKHLRAALRELHSDGTTPTNPKGQKLGQLLIRPAPRDLPPRKPG